MERQRALQETAARQHGVVGASQLHALGYTSSAIERLRRSGRLRSLHRGVYLVGPIASQLAAEMAAVVACGRGAVLSHGSASALWRLTTDPRSVPSVTLAGRAPDRPGIRVHRVRRLERDEWTRREGIPVTTPARTLLDLAAEVTTSELTARDLEQAVASAQRRGLVTAPRLVALLERHRRRRGTRALRAVLAGASRPAFTRSQAEERFLALIRSSQLPPPDVNVRVGRHEVDFVWRQQALAVEVDGYAFHAAADAFERDRRRDADLAALGFRVVRVTWRQIVEEGPALTARIAAALAVR